MVTPPKALVDLIHDVLYDLLTTNPAATSSESFVQHHVEFGLLHAKANPRYYLRIGINYHGDKVQHLRVDDATGRLVGWNPAGDALKIGKDAKLLLANVTIFDRDADEQLMSDSKVGGGPIPANTYVRIEFKVRGWLGKTKNLDGKQLEKDFDLLKHDRADILVICLSETAHKKWRGDGPAHHVQRRTGIGRFAQILVDPATLQKEKILERQMNFEGQPWTVSSRRLIGTKASIMPGAEHFITICWRR